MWLLNELGLKYETIPVDIMKGENQQESFRVLNPAEKVPVLVDGDLVLTESAAIQIYLLKSILRQGSSLGRLQTGRRCIAGCSFS
jgi:glutathione S-transferase